MSNLNYFMQKAKRGNNLIMFRNASFGFVTWYNSLFDFCVDVLKEAKIYSPSGYIDGVLFINEFVAIPDCEKRQLYNKLPRKYDFFKVEWNDEKKVEVFFDFIVWLTSAMFGENWLYHNEIIKSNFKRAYLMKKG
ncbi:MAG: hypothetical protein KBT27_07785 [Prevotellaceae bacterium]|nr:hypothetical protein [Candidatus Faecinaster equi]